MDITRAVVGPETDRRGLYVALTRGKKQNHVYVAEDTRIDLDAEGAHWHMSGDHHAPDHAQILRSIVEKDDGQHSATDLHRDLLTHENSDQRKGELLMTATDMLTTDWRRDVVEPDIRTRLDQLPVASLEAIDEDQAIERISTAVVRLSQHGIDYRELIEDATTDLEGSRDVGAVIAARLDQDIPAEAPAIKHLPPVHVGTDTELHDWVTSTREELGRSVERELRPLEYPLPAKGEVTGQDFRNADLRGLKFIGCDFDGAAFDDAEIHQTSFTDCSMQGVTFTGAEFGVGDGPLKLSPLTRVDLTGADFTDAQLVRSRFTSCFLRDATLAGATIGGRYQHVDFTGADFTDAEVAGNVSVADSALDDNAPEQLHQAQGMTLADRQHL